MRYNWDINELRKNRDILKEIYIGEPKSYTAALIIEYNRMLSIRDEDSVFKNHNLVEDLDYLINDVYNFSKHGTTPILELLFKSSDLLDLKKEYSLKIPKIYDNNETFRDNTLDFFREMTNKEIYNKACEVLNPENHILNIVNTNKNFNYAAMTFYDEINNKRYIGLDRMNTLTDYHDLAHEIFHYVFQAGYINKPKKAIFNGTLLSEIEGSFADILAADYHKRITKDKDKNFQDLFIEYNLMNYKSKLSKLLIKNSLMLDLEENIDKYIDEDSMLDMNKLNELDDIIFKFDNSEFIFKSISEIVRYTNQTQKHLTKYTLAFLVALDLYYIYLEDKERAFHLLKRIKNDKLTKELLPTLNKYGITFMEDDYISLKKYLKKD